MGPRTIIFTSSHRGVSIHDKLLQYFTWWTNYNELTQVKNSGDRTHFPLRGEAPRIEFLPRLISKQTTFAYFHITLFDKVQRWILRLNFTLFYLSVGSKVMRSPKGFSTRVQKKHPLTFYFTSPWVMCRLKQKLQWIYLRNVDSENVKITYSLRLMT